MDAVELSRKRASELHFQTASTGHDPWVPYDFAIAAAETRNLSVEKCGPGAAVLDGARAIFLPGDNQILHENTGSLFEQAFLVAHEIGHALLGDGESEDSDPVEIDPARSAEASPVGMDRVIDYSNRQRREVQMDLFAREFLLPREWVKKLHVDNGMTCTEIATKAGAPFEVVAQQLLDALLLPMITIEDSKPLAEIPLNAKQEEAAIHRGNAFLLQAGPGTGKTRTLVARVESLIAEGVDPRRILLLTFSNKAAAEMADRIAKKCPDEATSLWIGTFHGFGLDILRRFNDKCGLPANPRLLDRVEAVDFIEDEILRLGLKHYRNLYDPSDVVADILSAISRAKDEVIDAVSYLSLAQQMLTKASNSEEVEAAEKAIEVANVYSFYEQAKLERGSIDFGDLVMLPVMLLEQNETVRLKLQQSYDHVLVDEYQDVNRSSIRLLNALKPDGKNLWVVGDAKQSIYRFRGASSFNMSRFGNEDFPGGISTSLEINYRSTPDIVDAYSKFAEGMSVGTSDIPFRANRSSIGVLPEIRSVANGTLMGCAIAESIQEHLSSGYAYREQAVLTRGNTNLSKLSRELESLGIPVLFLGSLFERPEIRDLIALISILVDKRAMGLLRTANWPPFEMPMEDIVLIFDHLRQSESEPRAWMSIDISGMSEEGRVSLNNLSEALRGFDEHSNPWQVLAQVLLDRTSGAASISQSGTVMDQAKGIAIWQFMNFLRAQPTGKGLPIPRLMDRMRRLVRLRDERDLRQLPYAAQSLDAVRLMTIHGSKGLEFPVVHLAGCNPASIPTNFRTPRCLPPQGMIAGTEDVVLSAEKTAHGEEEECLFYVAASRAKDQLLFYGATGDVNGKKRQLSPYLTRLGKVTELEIVPKLSVVAGADQTPILVSFSGVPTFGSEALSLYEKCGRRFLYTYLLQVGGRRRMTAFTNMHEAVREVYKLVVGADNSVSHDCNGLLEAAFEKAGLLDHGYVEDYRAIGKSMLEYFIASRIGASYEQPTALQVSFGDCYIEVRPDDILIRDGHCTLRRVRTGHFRKDDLEDLNATAFIIAAQKHFPEATIELVYLADENATTLTLNGTKLSNRQTKITSYLSDINAGLFEANQNEFTCPNCPAYFVCGPTPPGTLIRNFKK